MGIEVDDIDLQHWQLTIRATNAKTRMERVLPLSYQTVEILKRFLLIREDDWSKYLFLTINGTKMTTNTWELRLKHYIKQLGCKFTPYDLRHTFSLIFLRNRAEMLLLYRKYWDIQT